MRISGTEPSSVILSQRKQLKKVKNNAKKYRKKLQMISITLCSFFWYKRPA